MQWIRFQRGKMDQPPGLHALEGRHKPPGITPAQPNARCGGNTATVNTPQVRPGVVEQAGCRS